MTKKKLKNVTRQLFLEGFLDYSAISGTLGPLLRLRPGQALGDSIRMFFNGPAHPKSQDSNVPTEC